MTATIIEFPKTGDFKNRQIDEIVDTKLQHPNPEVLKLWRKRVKAIFKSYQPEPFSFTVHVPEEISDQQLAQITLSIETTLAKYQKQLNQQKYAMLNDLCMLECKICEFELQQEKS